MLTRRRVLLRIGLALGAPLVLLLVAELVLQLAGYGKLPARAYDPRIGWRLLPNQTRVMATAEGEAFGEIRTNELGYRGPTFPVEKPDDVTRIACLGDSFTFGWGVAEEECWPWILQEALEEEAPGRFQVMSFAMSGYNFWNNLQTYRLVARDYSPDVVLLGAYLNDAQPESGGPRHTNSAFARFVGRTALAEAFHRHLRWRIPWFHSGRTPERKAYLQTYRRNLGPIEHDPTSELARPYWKEAMGWFGELAEAVRADGGKLGVLFFPARWQAEGMRLALGRAESAREHWTSEARKTQCFVERHAAEHQVPFLDLLETFATTDGVLYGGIDDGHPTAVGYELSAGAVRAFLAREFDL